jgi:zeaxanthin glucosyltransferase
MPKEFDFPRIKLPSCFHYTGPFIDPSGFEPTLPPSVAFPYERLNDKPLIYASLGTIQNQEKEYFEIIANACAGLDIQLLISLGGTDMNPSDYSLPNAIGVPFAPHQQVIKKSDLVITHAGLNTVLGALAEGKPMVAIPITNEQPGISARIRRCGAGEVVPLKNLHVDSLRGIIRLVLKEDKYKHNAKQLQHAIKKAGGAKRAAEIIELAISTRKPVLSGSL